MYGLLKTRRGNGREEVTVPLFYFSPSPDGESQLKIAGPVIYFLVMELHPVFVNGFEGFSYPAKSDLYSGGQYKIWRNISSRVDIPKAFFKDVKGETELSIVKISFKC